MDLTPIFYGLAVAAILGLSWASKSHVYQKLALQLMAAWALSNVLVGALGFSRAPLVIPTLDAVIAILVATVGYTNRSRVALVVFLLYAVVGIVHVVGFVTHRQATYTYYAVLNVLFLAQLMAVGGASAWMAVRVWSDRSRQRARAYRPRWAGLG